MYYTCLQIRYNSGKKLLYNNNYLFRKYILSQELIFSEYIIVYFLWKMKTLILIKFKDLIYYLTIKINLTPFEPKKKKEKKINISSFLLLKSFPKNDKDLKLK